MARFVLKLPLATALAFSGCYAPAIADCAYACQTDVQCPDGLVCDASAGACRAAEASGACPGAAIDAALSADATAPADAGNGSCSIAASFAPMFGSDTQAVFDEGPTNGSTIVTWEGELTAKPVQFDLLLDTLSGAPGDLDWPTTLGPKSGISLATATDVLVGIATADGSGNITDLYIATSGTLDLTSAGSALGDLFAGDAHDLIFTHADAQTGSAEPDGCMSAIASVSFSATVAAP